MEMYNMLVFFLFGVIFGSFYNVVGLRVPKGESVVSPPSHCTVCARRLTAIDLVPICSYLLLKGRCRKCKTKISPIYPFMELMTGLLFMHSYATFGFSKELIVALLFASLLVIITVSDIAYMLIPNKIVYPAFVLFIALRWMSPLDPWWYAFVGSAVGFSLLLLIAILSKGGMGGGDIKLYAVLGLVLGVWNTLLSLFLASLIALGYGAFILAKRKQKRRVPIPFGPAIALGAWISYIYGEQMIDWYLRLF